MKLLCIGLIIIILFSCKKETEDIYMKDYLYDNGICLNINGVVGEHDLNENLHLFLYDEYWSQSRIEPMGDGMGYLVYLVRYTNDYQSFLNYTIVLDENYQLNFWQANASIELLVDQNQLIKLYFTTLADDTMYNINYNPENGNLTFDFQFNNDNNNDQDYDVMGSANVILYQY